MKTQRITPRWLGEKIVFQATQLHKKKLFSIKSILEPSAGEGLLADLLLEINSNIKASDITCVELNSNKSKICESKGYNTYHGDFLTMEFDYGDSNQDIIVAAPPFNNNVDIFHIMKMYKLLNNNGVLVTLTSPYWLTNNEIHQCEFRKWLTSIPHSLEMLPDNTFFEKSKTVPTAMLTINKL